MHVAVSAAGGIASFNVCVCQQGKHLHLPKSDKVELQNSGKDTGEPHIWKARGNDLYRPAELIFHDKCT